MEQKEIKEVLLSGQNGKKKIEDGGEKWAVGPKA